MILSFCRSEVIPEGFTGAWGARLIVNQDGHTDLLHDRQSVAGEDTRALLGRLNSGLLSRSLNTISDLLSCGQMSTRQGEDFIIHMEDDLVVWANTYGSAGYCYVTAFTLPAKEA